MIKSSILLIDIADIICTDDYDTDLQIYWCNLLKYQKGTVKLLFNVFALFCPDSKTYHSLALTCKAGRDVCREFMALKKFSFRKIIYIEKEHGIKQRYLFDNHGLEFGANIAAYKRTDVSWVTCVENGKEKYAISTYGQSDKLMFRPNLYCTRILSGNIMISGIGSTRIEMQNLKTNKRIAAIHCYGCGKINKIITVPYNSNNPFMYRKCREGKGFGQWKFYRGDDDLLPMSLSCRILKLYRDGEI